MHLGSTSRSHFSYKFISLISSTYHGLTSAVKVSNGITPFFESFVGFRQGCNLSPMLFNIFINDLTEIFDEKCCPVMIGNYNLNCLLYADDLLLQGWISDMGIDGPTFVPKSGYFLPILVKVCPQKLAFS